MKEFIFQIDGMHCGACVQRVTRVLNQVPGTSVEEVRVGAARLRSESSASAPYVTAIGKAGFEAHLVE